MTPKQKKFAALAPPRNKITYADKIAGATKKTAKRGKAKIKAQAGVYMSNKAISGPKKKSGMVDQMKNATQTQNRIMKMLASNVKLLDTLSPKQREELQLMFGKEKIKLKGKMKKAGLKTTPRRAGGLKAAVKKIKADKGKAVVSDRLKSLQKQTSMKMKSPKLVRMKALSAQTGRRRGR